MIQSHSSLKAFESCAFKYAQIKVYKNYKEIYKTGDQLSGRQIHALLQDAISFKERDVRASEKQLQPALNDMWACVDAAEKSGLPYIIKMENNLAVDRNFNPSEYWDKSGRTFYRGNPDFYVVCGNACALRDIKTGKATYETDTQLCEMAVLIKAHHPEVEHVNAKYIFTREGHHYPKVNVSGDDFERYQKRILHRCSGPEKAKETGDYPVNPTALCGYCIVDSCDHYTGFTGHD